MEPHQEISSLETAGLEPPAGEVCSPSLSVAARPAAAAGTVSRMARTTTESGVKAAVSAKCMSRRQSFCRATACKKNGGAPSA